MHFRTHAQNLSFGFRKLFATALKFAVSKMDVTVQILIDAVATTVNSIEQLYSVRGAVYAVLTYCAQPVFAHDHVNWWEPSL